MISPDKQLLLSLWHNLIFKSIKQLNFWHFGSETDQNCIGKEFVVSCRNKRNLNNTLFSRAFHYSKKTLQSYYRSVFYSCTLWTDTHGAIS